MKLYPLLDGIITKFGSFLPDKLYLSLMYRLENGTWINWKHPKTFTEKLQWLKVYDFKPWYSKLVDKLAVKEYVASKIGEKYIIPTIGTWNRVEDIDWDSLPKQFVLKTTHGGGSGGVVICYNKNTFDREAAAIKLARSMKNNAAVTYREKPYLAVPRKILSEKLLTERDSNGVLLKKDLNDYKFFCFNGKPIYCQVIRNRITNDSIGFYDMCWNHTPFVGLNPRHGAFITNGDCPVKKPKVLEQMKDICCILSKGLKFVRIDLYDVNDQIYFGEITFYPASGFGFFKPERWNDFLGSLLKLG